MNIVLNTAAVLTLITTAAKCKIDLVILENTGDAQAPIASSIIEATKNKNLSLTCKILNSNNDSFKNEVVWENRRKFPRLENKADLNFTPIQLDDEGPYFCKSPKYGLSKIVYIAVTPYHQLRISSQNRRKRSNGKHGKSDFRGFYTNYARHHDKPSNSYPVSSHTSNTGYYLYGGVIVAVTGVLFIVGYLLYRLMKHLDIMYSISPERIPSEMEPACNHPSCGQFCTFTPNNNEEMPRIPFQTIHLNSANSNTRGGTPTYRPLPALGGISSHDGERSEPDLPPPYDKLVNTDCDKNVLPPVYSEAMSVKEQELPSRY